MNMADVQSAAFAQGKSLNRISDYWWLQTLVRQCNGQYGWIETIGVAESPRSDGQFPCGSVTPSQTVPAHGHALPTPVLNGTLKQSGPAGEPSEGIALSRLTHSVNQEVRLRFVVAQSTLIWSE